MAGRSGGTSRSRGRSRGSGTATAHAAGVVLGQDEGDCTQRKGSAVATFVLVHGGYHGGWCWDRLVPHLEAAGHACVAPDLPIDDPAAGYDEYAEAVLRAMSAAGVGTATEVVLVGHSLGCYITPMVAARTPATHVVSLCAVPA